MTAPSPKDEFETAPALIERLRAHPLWPTGASRSLTDQAAAMLALVIIELERARTAPPAESERAMIVADAIVCEEWHRVVEEFGLRPGSPTETLVGRVLERIRFPKDKTP